MVAYRSLCPLDQSLPSAAELGFSATPRKGEAAYAEVIAAVLRAAQRRHSARDLERAVFVGDTLRSDGAAFETLCAATGWRGRALICDETAGAAPTMRWRGGLAQVNAWQALYAFQAALEADEFHVDDRAVVVVDLDKTLLGARGRNHALIDQARLQALRDTVAAQLGSTFDADAFRSTYLELDQARYHPLTADNQDYLAYLCVAIGAGALTLADVQALSDAGRDFAYALERAGAAFDPTSSLGRFQNEIAALVAAGDPTPFMHCRRREYVETLARMGSLPDDAPPEQLLREEIVLTHEVWQVARVWQSRGALLFGLSDKPDEAAMPTSEAAAAGMQPLHRVQTHLVGI
jgi:hypothetical protein